MRRFAVFGVPIVLVAVAVVFLDFHDPARAQSIAMGVCGQIATAIGEEGKQTLIRACKLALRKETKFGDEPASKYWCGNFWRFGFPTRVPRDEDRIGLPCVGKAADNSNRAIPA